MKNKMKKYLLAMTLSAAVGIGMAVPAAAAETETVQTEADGRNPVMNYIGVYGNNRCTIAVSESGDNEVNVSVSWSSSAWEHNEWTMSGHFDPDTKTVTYENAECTTHVFNEDGEEEETTVVYEDGKGSFTFEDTDRGIVLTWNDEKEHVADGTEFTNYLDASGDAPGEVMAFMSETEIKDGVITIRISPEAAGGGFSWSFDNSGNDRKVELVTDTTEEKGYSYVGSFRGIADGDDKIRLLFGNGVYVQQYRDFDVTVKDGKIIENKSGFAALPTTHDDLAGALEGTWVEKNGSRSMTLELDAVDGFDVTVSDGSGRDGKTQLYLFTAYYDAVEEGLIYRDGTTVEAAISGEDEKEAEPAAKTGDGSGVIRFHTKGDDEYNMELQWKDNASDGEPVLFERES